MLVKINKNKCLQKKQSMASTSKKAKGVEYVSTSFFSCNKLKMFNKCKGQINLIQEKQLRVKCKH